MTTNPPTPEERSDYGDDSRGRRVIDCGHLTVEYESVRGRDSVLLVPFPSPPDADEHSIILTGSPDDLRAIAEAIISMADEWDDES